MTRYLRVCFWILENACCYVATVSRDSCYCGEDDWASRVPHDPRSMTSTTAGVQVVSGNGNISRNVAKVRNVNTMTNAGVYLKVWTGV